MNSKKAVIVDCDLNTIVLKEEKLNQIMENLAPLDIVSQVGNENDDCEMIHELSNILCLNYVKQLEEGLISALDELSLLYKQNNKEFDYYDKLVELTKMNNSRALDFLDMFSDN